MPRIYAFVSAVLLVGCSSSPLPSPGPDAASLEPDGGEFDGPEEPASTEAGVQLDAGSPPPYDGAAPFCIAPGNPCGGEEAGIFGPCCDSTSYRCVDDGTVAAPFTGRCALGLCCETDAGSTFLGDGGACDGGTVRACW